MCLSKTTNGNSDTFFFFFFFFFFSVCRETEVLEERRVARESVAELEPLEGRALVDLLVSRIHLFPTTHLPLSFQTCF